MKRYRMLSKVGDGAYGTVWKAINPDEEVVAVKIMKKKFGSMAECMHLPEVKALRAIRHPHIVLLKGLVREQDELNLIFEFCDANIHELLTDVAEAGRAVPEDKVRRAMHQLFSALAHMHAQGCNSMGPCMHISFLSSIFHRDIKPENLLVRGGALKLCDFGLAKELRSREPLTDYVSTRWYRAPEASGVVMAELYLRRPLFAGHSHQDMLFRICSVLGTPTAETWADGCFLASSKGLSFPQFRPTPLSTVINDASSEALQLLEALLRWDPILRPSAYDTVNLPYFGGEPPVQGTGPMAPPKGGSPWMQASSGGSGGRTAGGFGGAGAGAGGAGRGGRMGSIRPGARNITPPLDTDDILGDEP